VIQVNQLPGLIERERFGMIIIGDSPAVIHRNPGNVETQGVFYVVFCPPTINIKMEGRAIQEVLEA
jgi:hypothetical protein